MSSPGEVYDVLGRAADGAHIEGMKQYQKMYNQSVKDPIKFWKKQAETLLHWCGLLLFVRKKKNSRENTGTPRSTPSERVRLPRAT